MNNFFARVSVLLLVLATFVMPKKLPQAKKRLSSSDVLAINDVCPQNVYFGTKKSSTPQDVAHLHKKVLL